MVFVNPLLPSIKGSARIIQASVFFRVVVTPFFFISTSFICYILYMDDIIISRNDPSLLHNFVSCTQHEFAIKDLSRLNYFLGLEASYTFDSLFVGQTKYAHDILERAELLDAKHVSTPLALGKSLLSDGSSFRDLTLHRSLVGAL